MLAKVTEKSRQAIKVLDLSKNTQLYNKNLTNQTH